MTLNSFPYTSSFSSKGEDYEQPVKNQKSEKSVDYELPRVENENLYEDPEDVLESVLNEKGMYVGAYVDMTSGAGDDKENDDTYSKLKDSEEDEQYEEA